MTTIAPEIIKVDKNADGVSCDGGMGELGHPTVYYTFDGTTTITCSYCGRKFVKK